MSPRSEASPSPPGPGPGRAANLTLAFVLELAVLVAFGTWGFELHTPTAVRWTLGLGIPAATAVLWGALAAPTARRRLPRTPLLFFKLAIFTLGSVALYSAGHRVPALILQIVAVGNLALAIRWDQV
jgi:hypothetical protein